jgi:hypothetical protein
MSCSGSDIVLLKGNDDMINNSINIEEEREVVKRQSDPRREK